MKILIKYILISLCLVFLGSLPLVSFAADPKLVLPDRTEIPLPPPVNSQSPATSQPEVKPLPPPNPPPFFNGQQPPVNKSPAVNQIPPPPPPVNSQSSSNTTPSGSTSETLKPCFEPSDEQKKYIEEHHMPSPACPPPPLPMPPPYVNSLQFSQTPSTNNSVKPALPPVPSHVFNCDPDSCYQLFVKLKKNGILNVIVSVNNRNIEGMSSTEEIDKAEIDLKEKAMKLRNRVKGMGTNDLEILNYLALGIFGAVIKTETGLKELLDDPDVVNVHEERQFHPSLWHANPLIGSYNAWQNGGTGTGQSVVVIDVGVDITNPMLKGKVINGACFSNSNGIFGYQSLCPNGGSTDYSFSQDGAGTLHASTGGLIVNTIYGDHATSVASIIAGNSEYAGLIGPNGTAESIVGASQYSTIISAAVISKLSGIYDVTILESDVISALQWAYNIRGSYKIAAVNMSLEETNTVYSGYCDGNAMKPLIDQLKQAGIPTVTAAGNGWFSNETTAPGCISSSIEVTGSNNGSPENQFYFNNDNTVMFYAPGYTILVPNSGYYGNHLSNGVLNAAYLAGSSLAAPFISAGFSIIRSKYPAASISDMVAALQQSGVLLTDPRNNVTRPRIQIDKALSFLDVKYTSPPPSGGGGPGSTVPPASIMMIPIFVITAM